jgi:hypothetical protein
MPSVKISDLPVLSQLSANNANTVFVVVDKTTNTTSQFSTTVLAQGLYANNILNVGTANTGLLLPNSVAQFISNTAIFSQVNFQNINSKGSADIVITADNGDNSNNYLDLGVQGSNMDADPLFDLPNNDGYLYMHGRGTQKQGNLWIGTATSNTDLVFFTGAHKQANEIGRFEDGVGLSLRMPIKFADGTTQNTAASPAAVTLATQANTIITQGVDATQNTRLNAIETNNINQNTSIGIIQGVDATQNTQISGIQGVNLAQNASITIIQGVDDTQNTRLNAIETINANQNTSISIIEAVNNTQNTRLNAIETINTSQNTSIGIIQGVDLTQNTTITAVNNYANSAYAKANAALANTSGTFDGDLRITGDLTVVDNTTTNTAVVLDRITFNNNALIRTTTGSGNQKDITILTGNELSDNESGDITLQTGTAPINATGGNINLIPGVGGLGRGTINLFANTVSNGIVTIQNSTFNPNNALVKITASDGFVTQTSSNTNYMLHVTGKANSVTRVVLDSFGANTYPVVVGRMGRGSAAAPVAVANNDVMMRIVGNGWTGTQFPSSSPAKIDFTAAENFSDTNRGTRIEFWNTPVGSNTIQKIADFNAGSAEFLGTVNPEKGFIYSPTILAGNQTAFTIDFSTTSLIKATLVADLTISHSNYVAGKVVEVWLTNTGGPGRTVTHGCTATNSTVNSTTFTISGTSSAYLRYFSIDGDNANTFVSIQYA